MTTQRRIILAVLVAAVSGCGPNTRVEPAAVVTAQGDVSAVAFSPAGSTLATAETDRGGVGVDGVILRDVTTGHVLRRIPASGRVGAFAFAPGGAMLAVADGAGRARVFNPDTGERLASLDGPTGRVDGLAFSPDGALLAACGSGGGGEGAVTVWEVSGWRVRPGRGFPGRAYRSVAFGPGGRTYVTGAAVFDAGRPDAGEVTLWDAATGRPLWSHKGLAGAVECVAYAPGGGFVASGGVDGVVKFWGADDGVEAFAADFGHGRADRVFSVAFAPAGATLAVGLGGRGPDARWGALQLLDVGETSARAVQALHGTSPVTCVAFSPDGRLLAAGDGDGVVRLWEAAKCLPGGAGRQALAGLGRESRRPVGDLDARTAGPATAERSLNPP